MLLWTTPYFVACTGNRQRVKNLTCIHVETSFLSSQMRVLKNDFARYNLDEDEVEDLDQDENGWKIIHTDVFRFPPYKTLLCAILGKC